MSKRHEHHAEIGQAEIAALGRRGVGNPFVLGWGEFHVAVFAHSPRYFQSVLTGPSLTCTGDGNKGVQAAQGLSLQ